MQNTFLRELIFAFIFSVYICINKFVIKYLFNNNGDDEYRFIEISVV